MTLDRNWLLGTARAEREALGRTIQYTPPDRWETESVSAGWRNRDIVGHLASDDVLGAAVIADESATELDEYLQSLTGQPFTMDGFNEWGVRRRADQPLRALIGEWGRAADLFLARASKITPDEWTSRRVQWVAGEIGVSYLVQSRVMEWWLHGEDLRVGADLEPRIEHPPMFCVNDLAVRMIPYALRLAGLRYTGRSVEVELSGAGGGSWHYGLAPRETPDPGKEPDTVIKGRGYPFALVAGRRVPAEYYLAHGEILIGGDVELGESILHHLRAFAG